MNHPMNHPYICITKLSLTLKSTDYVLATGGLVVA